MTRIGFAYNQKPDDSNEFERQINVSGSSGNASLDEEPPSFARALGAQTGTTLSVERSPSVAHADDAFAEWDSPETILAVEKALSGLGDVVRLEAAADFPERLRDARPDIVFNMAE